MTFCKLLESTKTLVLIMISANALAAQPLVRIGQHEVVEDDFVYAMPDGYELRAHTYRPEITADDTPLPAVVEVHGGAWNLYDRMAGEHYNRALASSGLFVMAIDFRQGPDFQHPLGSRDVAGAVRYLRRHAARLQVDADSIGLIGSSSGGHLTLLAGTKPDAEQHRGTALKLANGEIGTADEVSAAVDYVVALWPVADPAYRYQFANDAGRSQLVALHENYFGNEANMRDASIARVLADGEATTPLPAVLIVQPGNDENIPRPMTFALMEAYQNAGGHLDYAFFPDQPHGFAHRPSAATDACIETMRGFISHQIERRLSVR